MNAANLARSPRPRLPEWAIPKRSKNGQEHGKPRNGKPTTPAGGTNGNGNGNHRSGFYRDELAAGTHAEELGTPLLSTSSCRSPGRFCHFAATR